MTEDTRPGGVPGDLDNVVRPVLEVPGSLLEDTARIWHTLAEWVSFEHADRFVCRFGGRLAWLEYDDNGALIVVGLDRRRALNLLANLADWIKVTKDAAKPMPPPRAVADNILVDRDPPVATLDRITEVPVIAPDGSLHDRPGYDVVSRCFYAPASGLGVPSLPDKPSGKDVAKARALIAEELLGDFPFTGPNDGASERAHAVALLLLPFVRVLIAGASPLHLIEAPTPGTGKTLLAQACAAPALGGRTLQAMSEARDGDEWRKRLVAKLRTAAPFVLIDNLRGTLDSGALSSAITTGEFEDRLLGVSDMIRLPVRCGWICTGNNPRLSDEITRRTVRIRIDSGREHPERREGFRHPDLRAWAHEKRGELVWAALVLARAWIVAGRPEHTHRAFGGFEAWASVMGGILDHAEIPGLLGNADELRTYSQDAAERDFLADVFERHPLNEFTASDVIDLGRLHFGFDGSGGQVAQRVGVAMREIVDRPMGGLVLRRSTAPGGIRRWRIEKRAENG